MTHRNQQNPRVNSDDAAEVIALIQTIARRLRRTEVDTSAWGLSPHQARALGMIDRWVRMLGATDGIRISDLAARLHIAPRSATEVVDALQQRDLVDRSPDPNDRRAVLVCSTGAGSEIAQQIIQQRRHQAARLLDTVPERQQHQLRVLLEQAWEALEGPESGPGHSGGRRRD